MFPTQILSNATHASDH